MFKATHVKPAQAEACPTLRKFAGAQFPQRGCALQANVIVGIVPQAIAQHGKSLRVRRAGFALRSAGN